MFSKIIVVLATVCVVNASVISVNVFDDDPETDVPSNPKDCNFRACDQLCRRLKFPSGACVNGRCKCDNFRNAEDEVSVKTLSGQEDLVSQTDDSEAENAAISSRCNLKVCDRVCRWLTKTSGACVAGRCKCAKSIIAEDVVSESNVEDSVPSRACNNKKCHQLCRKQKFRGGACLGANCYCNKFLSLLEDTMTEAAESLPLSSCNSIACDDQCRRTGWHSGVCINGQCKCDYFVNTEVSENSLSNLEDSVSPRKCTHQECNALCRRLKFREGVCIAGRCSCNNYFPTPKDTMNDLEESMSLDDNFLSTEDEFSDEFSPISELSEDQTERGCNMRACDQLCRRLKFRSGACVNGRCKCDNFLNTEVSENSLPNLEDSVSPRKCTHQECNALCRRLKFREGVCIAGRCSCNNYFPNPKDTMNDLEESISLDDNFFNTEDEVSDESSPISELSEDQTERGCNMRACDQLCRRLKFPGGACVNGRCKCDNFFGTEDAVDEYSEFAPRRVCRLTKCNRKCTRRGYEGATCVNGRCKCYNNLQEKDEISETSLPLSELSEDQTERGCNIRACDQLCRRLKFPGGACFNGRCKCYNYFGTEETVDEYSELATRRVCKLRQCNRTCTRRGYESARCVNGWCNCYNKIQRQDASLLNDVNSNENEESNVVLRTKEEELIVPSPSACNTVNCNEMCHRLKYAGGWCRFGQCQCY